MKTFDYEKAWQDLALPAFKQLPENILFLVEHTGIESDELGQDGECAMIWPDDGGKLRGMFDAIDGETLSHAANVVYYYNHWRPSASIAGDAPTVKCGWKFSNYADQSLRARLGISGRDSNARISFQIHEGKIRLCYSSRDMWAWEEVSMATPKGLQMAQGISSNLSRKIATHGSIQERDSAAYKFFEALKKETGPGFNIADYMVEESEIELRRAARMPKPDKEKLIAETYKEFESKVAVLTTERDGDLWLINHDLPKDNCIFYSHTGQFCFGWRKPYTGEARLKLLEALKDFPFSYDVKAEGSL